MLLKKLHFWLAALACALCSVAYAQTDVTDSLLSNAGFDNDSLWTTDNVTAKNGSANLYDVEEWTVSSSSSSSWNAGASFAIGGSGQINGVSIPTTNADSEAEGGVLGISAGWGCTVCYEQDVTLPAGIVNITYAAYNANSGATTIGTNLIGFVAEDGTTYYGSTTSFTYGEWVTEIISFELDAETSGTISVGMKPNSGSGSGSHAKLCIDYIQITTGLDLTEYNAVKAEADSLLQVYDYECDARDTLEALIDAEDPTTLDGLSSALDALEEAIEEYEAVAGNADYVDGFNALADSYTVDVTAFAGGIGDWGTGSMTTTNKGQHWDGTSTSTYYEQTSSQWSASSWTTGKSTSITLPKGKYVFYASGRSSSAVTATLSALGDTVIFPANGDTGRGIATDGTASFSAGSTYANSNAGYGWQWRYIEVENDDEATETDIAVDAAATATHSWVSISDFAIAVKPDFTDYIDNQYSSSEWSNDQTLNGGHNFQSNTCTGGEYSGTMFETWTAGVSSEGRAIYRTEKDLPNGLYTLKAAAYANATGAYLYGNYGETAITDYSNNAYYTVDNVVVDDNTLELGIKAGSDIAAQWMYIADITLTYKGIDTDSIYAVIEEALEVADSVAELTQSTATLTALTTAISAAKAESAASDYSTLLTLCNSLMEAIAASEESVADNADLAAGDSIEATGSVTGWATTNSQTLQYNTWSSEADDYGVEVPFVENWVASGSTLDAGTKTYYTAEGLAEGSYKVTGTVRIVREAGTDTITGAEFFVNDATEDLTETGTLTTSFNSESKAALYGFIELGGRVGEDGVLEFGLNIGEDANYNWVAFKDFYYQTCEEASNKDSLLAAIEASTVAYDAAYIGDGVYLVSTDDGDTYASAIEAAQTVYDEVLASEDEVNEAITALLEADSVFAAAEVNQPGDTVLYVIKQTSSSLYLSINEDDADNKGDVVLSSSPYTFYIVANSDSTAYLKGYAGDYILRAGTYTLGTVDSITSSVISFTLKPYQKADDGTVYYELVTDSTVTTILGTDATSSGSTVFCNKSEGNSNGLWIITEATTFTGDPTIEGIENGQYIDAATDSLSFTISYPSAMVEGERTNPTVNGSVAPTFGSTEGTATVDDEGVVTITFSGLELEQGTEYTITLPAGLLIFSDELANDTVTLTVTAVQRYAEGDYYFKVDGEYKYLSRGGSWGTELVIDPVGILFTLVDNEDGTFYLESTDRREAGFTKYYVSGPTSAYADADSYSNWSLEEAGDDTYYIVNSDGNYLCGEVESTYGYTWISETSDSTAAPAFELLSRNEYKASLADRLDEQAAAAAKSAGLELASVAEIEGAGYLSATDMTDSIQNPNYAATDGWSVVATNYNRALSSVSISNYCAEIWNTVGAYYQTVTDLPEGLYKVTANAFNRMASLSVFTSYEDLIDVASVSAYLYANTSETENITSLGFYDDYSDWANVNTLPNVNTVLTASDTAWLQTMYVYVPEDGELTLGFVADGYTEYGWNVVANWTLTLLEKVEDVEVTISEAGYATLYYGDRDLEVAEGVTAYTVAEDSVDLNGGYIYLTEIEDGIIPAATAVVLGGTAGTYTFTATAPSAEAIDGNILEGTDNGKTVTDDTDYYYYVLTYSSDKSDFGFYWQYEDGHSLLSSAHKGYLVLSADDVSGVKGFRFSTGDATGISAVNADEDAEAVEGIYSLQGIKLNGDVESLQPGLYIINGKKTLIK